MKYAIVIPDGCADEPQDALDGRTPLQAAATPAMDAVANEGLVGLSTNVPESLPAGSDVANMSLLGYDPLQFFSGRAPLEAAAQGIELGPGDWAVRCNLVTVKDQVMQEFTAGHISTEEAKELLSALQERVNDPQLQFVPGVSYRNLLLFRDGELQAPFTTLDTRTTPPHDLTDKSIADDYPRGPGSDLLTDLMQLSHEVFADHPVNRTRIQQGKPPATNVWLWGLGKSPALPKFAERFGKSGAMITAVDLLFGLAELIGWDQIHVRGATGYLDTDYAAKGRYAIEAIRKFDVVCVHIEAPDEASHEGNTEAKIEALERIDQDIVGPLHQALKDQGEYRLLVTPDHPTPLRLKTHSHGLVPFTVAGAGISRDAAATYDEVSAGESGRTFAEGWRLMSNFLGDWTA